jgi:hypothetical protein
MPSNTFRFEYARFAFATAVTAFIICAIAYGLWTFINIISSVIAFPHDMGHYDDPTISLWYKNVRQPDHPAISCCGYADAYWADEVTTGPNGETIAVITDDRDDEPLGREHIPIGTRYIVPPGKIKWDQGNPTGHIVIFLGYATDFTERPVVCYAENGGV